MDTDAKAMIYGMGRQTGRAELVRAVDECIAYQVTDIVKLMEEESGFPILEVRADGGASRGEFLMHFQSDLLNVPVVCCGKRRDLRDRSRPGGRVWLGLL